MKKCLKCGTECYDEDVFCMGCGLRFDKMDIPAQMEQPVQQPVQPVQQPIQQPIQQVQQPIQPVQPAQMEQPVQQPVQQGQSGQPGQPGKGIGSLFAKFPKKIWIIAGAAAAAIVAAVVLILVLSGNGGDRKNYILYVKDGELMYSNLSQKEPFQVSTRMFEGASNENLSLTYLYSGYINISPDGKNIFYVDKSDMGSMKINLYYRRLNDEKTEPVKIDSDISNVRFNTDYTLVFYLKNGTLYRHDLTEKVKIASDVDVYKISNDGKDVVWLNGDGKLSKKTGDNDAEKIDSDVDSIEYMSYDTSKIYYIKNDDVLYVKSGKDEKQKIASGVNYIVTENKDGIYYTRSLEGSTDTYLDFINDDMLSSDQAVIDAGYPNYPDWDADDSEWDAYNKAVEEYNAASTRNSLRDSLSWYSFSQSEELICFDGKDKTTITDDFTSNYYTYLEGGLITYYSNKVEASRLKMSALYEKYFSDGQYEYSGFIDEVENLTNVSRKLNMIRKGVKTELELPEDAEVEEINHNGSMLLYSAEKDKNGVGELWSAKIGEASLTDNKKIDDEVYVSSAYYQDDHCIYFKDVAASSSADGNKCGALYVDGKHIYDDVLLFSTVKMHGNNVYFFDEFNTKKYTGTLMCYDGSKAKAIREDVESRFGILDNGSLIYLCDFNRKSYTGDLYLYDGKEKKIDEDVTVVIYPYQ